MAKKTIAIDVQYQGEQAQVGVEELIESINELKGSFEKASEEMRSGFEASKKGAEAAGKGVKGFGQSIKGLVASLGIVSLLAEAFNKLKELLMQNQTVADTFNTAMIALEVVFTKLIEKAVELGGSLFDALNDPKQAVLDLWDAIRENLVNRVLGVVKFWEGVGNVIKSALELDWDAVKEGASDVGSAFIQVATGLDEVQQAAALDSLKSFAEDVNVATTGALEYADALVKLRNEVKLLEAGQQEIQLTYQRDAELQRQIRDDIRLTLEERIAANNTLGRILENQLEVELNVAQKRLELAELEAERNRDNIDLQAEVLRARGELADVEERIIGQRAEQLTNQAALEKELFDLRQEIRVAEFQGREKELEELDLFYDAISEKARVAGEDLFEVEAARASAISELKDKFRREDLAKEEAAAKKRTQLAEAEKDARLTVAGGLAQGLSSLVQGLAGQSEASIAIQKTLAIAQLGLDTARSISSAIAGATSAAAATGPAAVVTTPLFIAQQVATVLTAIGQAVGIINSVPTGGAATLPSVNIPSGAGGDVPDFTPVTTNTTELGNVAQAELAPVQAFVVETEITGNQENIGQIEGQAEFGG